MIDFKPVTLADREWLAPILTAAPDRGCEYTFGNIYIWSQVSGIAVAPFDGGALVKFDHNPSCYLYPVGCCDERAAIIALLEDCRRENCDFCIIAARREDTEFIEREFPNMFRFHETRHFAEYVYNSEDLINLSGKKYHAKRNHIARFERQCDYRFVDITKENVAAVREFNEQWLRQRGEIDEGLRSEHTAVCAALDALGDAGLVGGFIESQNGIEAFAIGEPINDEVFCVHIEKASGTDGAYAIINREYARRFCKNYRLVNREDDAGEEGLRRAKLSYYPAYITEKFVIVRECADD